MNKTGHFNFAENRTFLLCLDNFQIFKFQFDIDSLSDKLFCSFKSKLRRITCQK
ncbi:MAG: hypothetical protein ACOX2F_01760 [bacterium]